MDDATLFEFHTLQRRVGEHTAGLGELLLEYGTPAAALTASDERLAALPPATQRAMEKARRAWPRVPSGRALNGAPQPQNDGGELFLPITHRHYPARLRDAPDPPAWLFCRGDPQRLAGPAVAIVGSRRASRAGLQAAHGMAGALARSGYMVCSGLALGIDAAAHRGALDGSGAGSGAADGSTVAVLASGLDRPSPVAHAALARRIAAQGCLLSELPPGTRPHRGRFPRRNRIISGISTATIIVEAALPSGSLHTAGAALEQGREVFVLPWSIFHPQGAGCLRLLRDGATPITSMDELAGFFPPLSPPSTARKEAPLPAPEGLSALAEELLDVIGDGAHTAADLQNLTRRPVAELFAVLSDLEIEGHLVRVDGRYERRV